MMGPKRSLGVQDLNLVGGNVIVHPIFQVKIPTILPQGTIDQMDLVYLQGWKVHKHQQSLQEQTIWLMQLLHIMLFGGLDSTKGNLLPNIWKNCKRPKVGMMQARKLSKWFRNHQSFVNISYQLHKELVEDIRKLMFTIGAAPLADNVYRGITSLTFTLMLVADEHTLQEDRETFNGATSMTPAAVRASK